MVKVEEESHRESLKELLIFVEDGELLNAIEIIEILSKNESLTVDGAKEFILKRINNEMNQIKQVLFCIILGSSRSKEIY